MIKSKLRKVDRHNVQTEQTFKQEAGNKNGLEYQTERHNKLGVIFINPIKINSFKQTECLKNLQSSNPSSTPNTKSKQAVSQTKIYLNPNFKNSVLPSFQNDSNRRKETLNNVGIDNTIVKSGTSIFDKRIPKLKCQKSHESNHEISNEPADSPHCVNKMQKIYINKHFTKLAREGANTLKIVQEKLSENSDGIKTSHNNLPSSSCSMSDRKKAVGVATEMKSSNDILSSVSLEIPKLHEQDKIKKSVSFDNTEKSQTSNTMLDKKVFINPTFRKRLSGSKTIYVNSIRNNLTVNNSETPPDNSLGNNWLKTLTRQLVKGNQESVSSKSTTTPFLPDSGQSEPVKTTSTGSRTRTRSTSLVSVSATKIVRRRKSNLKFEPRLTGSLNKLSYVSKTKLVRNALTKCDTDNVSFVKNDLICKSKLKSLVTKNNIQRLTPDKVIRLRQNWVKTSNGKSLQIISSNGGSNQQAKPSNVLSPINQPLFISKTKLVRQSVPVLGKDTNSEAAVKNVEKSNTELQSKTKQGLLKNHLHYLTLNKINNQRKQNASSPTSLSYDSSKMAYITKVKSNNGKSLKLVKNNEIGLSQKYLKASTSEKYSTTFKRKQLLQQEMNKNMMWMLRSKSRKSQFSKINVPVKKISSQSLSGSDSKYVYKNKDITARRQLTKAAVLKRRGSFGQVHASISTDKSKYIKSKYNLIRKSFYHSNSLALKVNKDKLSSRPKLESRLKMTLRMQNRSCKKHFKRKGLSIVNIGGVFYRCSRTSLTRNKPRPKQVLQKTKNGTILHIHGQKFKLERNGLTLTCLDKNPRRKRVDIGGVTFISSSSGTLLTRTNYHNSRSILVHAKQKSISLLTRKLKKNNEPCLFFHRFGKCSGKERGSCVRQHDPKNVAVCKKFVQGSCSDTQCVLSHTISCHNMPTCQHFLAGHCSRDNCLYPHIKVSDSASICLDFLKGYCEFGNKCTKRHRDICPSFEKGVCPRGKYCPYPHPKSKSGKSLSRLTVLRKPKPSRAAEVVSNSNLRYFDDVNLLKENKQEPEMDHNQPEEFISGEKEDGKLFRNRPKLGRLPSFIPLTDNDFCS